MKRKIVVIILTIMLVVLGYTYHRHRINQITSRYDWNTLLNILTTLDSILDEYEEKYQSRPVSEDEIRNNDRFILYFEQVYNISVYIDVSPNFIDTDLDLNLDRISRFDDGGISVEEIEYLINVRNKYEITLRKINDQLYENLTKGISGAFTRTNVEKLAAVFDGVPK